MTGLWPPARGKVRDVGPTRRLVVITPGMRRRVSNYIFSFSDGSYGENGWGSIPE